MTDTFETEKAQASGWFRELRDEIVSAFHALEDRQGGDAPAGRMEVRKTSRTSEDGSDAG
ncbi:coproporphyrinogen III oxidase, partial [Sulfitobacter mediterraneus]|nr:coproporphyrinogen III oxidase [Sulfitobacter mediterraneus]